MGFSLNPMSMEIYGFITHDASMGRLYIYLFTIKNQPNVGKFTSPMDPMGYMTVVLLLLLLLLLLFFSLDPFFKKNQPLPGILLPESRSRGLFFFGMTGFRKNHCFSKEFTSSTILGD